MAEAMAHLLLERREAALRALHVDCVMPVPQHWRRRLGRGADGAETMARAFGRSLRLPTPLHLVARHRDTLPQKELPPKARFHNVRGAFTVRANYLLAGTRVLLIDDTLTTGATCSEIAGTLKEAGAAAVHVAVLARAQGTHR